MSDILEMPTPCPQCYQVVELNDMNVCGTCRYIFCKDCLKQPWDDCDNCYDEDNEEY